MKTIANYTTINDTLVESIISELPFESISLLSIGYKSTGRGQYKLEAMAELDGKTTKLSVHSTDSQLIDNWNEDPENYIGRQAHSRDESQIIALRTIVRQLKDTF